MSDNTCRRASTEVGAASDASPVRRVVLAVNELRPGGAERIVVHLGGALRRRGMEPTVVSLGPRAPLADDLERAGVPTVCLGSTRGRDVRCLWRLRGLLRRLRPDVIHVHDRASLPYVAAAAWSARAGPIIYTGHGLMFGEDARPRARYTLAARRLATVTAVSDEVAARHAACLGWTGSIDVVPNGVPDAGCEPDAGPALRRELGLADGDFVFLAVGNARPEKAFENLVDAAGRLKRAAAGRPFAVLVAGGLSDSPYCRDLLARHRASGLGDTVRFLGYRDDVPALLSAADAFVLSSRSEGLPMVVLEAMMAGLPVVATRVGGVPGAVGDCGLLVDPEQPDALAAAMQRLMDDPALAADLGRRARERAIREYGLERMVDRYLAVYERVAARHRRRRG